MIFNWKFVFSIGNMVQRQKIDEGLSGGSDSEEEAPQVVVLKTGDLTAEEAEIEQKRIEKGKANHQMNSSKRNLRINTAKCFWGKRNI